METGSEEDRGRTDREAELEKLAQLKAEHPEASLRKIGKLLGCGKDRVKKLSVELRDVTEKGEPLVSV